MTDRPILFSGPMVRALLAGTKTQTRRLIDPDGASTIVWFGYPCDGDRTPKHPDRRCSPPPAGWHHYHHANGFHHGDLSPYAEVGDRLWVRETHRVVGWNDVERATVEYQADGTKLSHDVVVPDFDAWLDKRVKAFERQGATVRFEKGDDYASLRLPEGVEPAWTPSIFMQRWASRITLEVTEVRVERLQDITEADAWAEGIAELGKVTDPRGAYLALWDSINEDRAPSGSNPWVWVVSFRVVPS